MNNAPHSPPLSFDLVLIGGGHAHVHVLKQLGLPRGRRLRREHGIRVTLIASDVRTPYSGMLPGYVAGHYDSLQQIHIDLERLCRVGNIRLLHTAATAVTYNNNPNNHGNGTGITGTVRCANGRPPVRFDALSIDIGSAPSQQQNLTNMVGVTPVKPISQFALKFDALLDRFSRLLQQQQQKQISIKDDPLMIVVVGGGAGGVELALALHYRLQQQQQHTYNEDDAFQIVVVTRGTTILETHNRGVQRIMTRVLRERGIQVRYQAKAVRVEEYVTTTTTSSSSSSGGRCRKELVLSSDDSSQHNKAQQQSSATSSRIVLDECLWCTTAGAAPWLSRHTPFRTTADGFLEIDDAYQCVGAPGVFAAGDCSHMTMHPRPKAGVFAVRAGPILHHNLLQYLLQKPLRRHRPQSNFLSLISTGDRVAVASWGPFLAIKGRLLWKWKDHIDRAWMAQYTTDLPPPLDGQETMDKDE